MQDYSNHEIVAFLESIGAAFGACQNAMTSMDETIYEVSVPTDQPQFLQQTFSVLSQFATKIRCACTQAGNSPRSCCNSHVMTLSCDRLFACIRVPLQSSVTCHQLAHAAGAVPATWTKSAELCWRNGGAAKTQQVALRRLPSSS